MLAKGTNSLRTENHESTHETTQELQPCQNEISPVTMPALGKESVVTMCPECRADFVPKSPRHKFCCDACKMVSHRRKSPSHRVRLDLDKQRRLDRRNKRTTACNRIVDKQTRDKSLYRLGFSGTSSSESLPPLPLVGEFPLAPMPPRRCAVCSSILTNRVRTCDDCKAKAKLSTGIDSLIA